MEKIQFDSGVRAYRINGGTLRFNPGDPNIYTRFLEAVEKLREVEQELSQKAEDVQGAEIAKLMTQADEKMKAILSWIFGDGNDFQQILGGVNLLAVADNGERVVTNLFAALEPVLVAGAKRCADAQAAKVKAERSAKE